jgi:uncharacterized membrane protein (DUF373 family)
MEEAGDPAARGQGRGWRRWSSMRVYEGFERLVTLALSWVIAVVIAVSLIQLVRHLVPLVTGGTLDLLDHKVFETIFGMIMTLLIAMEFRHSITRGAGRTQSVIQVKTVVLISLMALSRKFVILDAGATEPATIAALAGATLVLGAVYWLLRERDDRAAQLEAMRDASGGGTRAVAGGPGTPLV